MALMHVLEVLVKRLPVSDQDAALDDLRSLERGFREAHDLAESYEGALRGFFAAEFIAPLVGGGSAPDIGEYLYH